ncbi:DUF1480 family protein [Rouxiella chamberiensis]|uniref:DUF1480 family protein n=1 Tax=Rouxiella chamberiensis TaxID=1513468 RepID=A0ABY7HUU4_9GAMM|nr:DUF1480 family protein [Rouxiella chamberiensis]WAT02814.1 DUF1480 family protein [Rouxiella chamberiensis]
MGKSSLQIGSFKIDDAQLFSPEAEGGNRLVIPCKSDPGLCMQLDGWDDDVSVPAIVDGRDSLLYKEKYDSQKDEWIMRVGK